VTRPLSLLMVEDCEADAELLLVELRRSGFDVVFERVATEAELRLALASDAWQIVVCDHGLPNFSSTEALQVVGDTGRDIPFVVLSGTIGEEAAVEALKAGARDDLRRRSGDALLQRPAACPRRGNALRRQLPGARGDDIHSSHERL